MDNEAPYLDVEVLKLYKLRKIFSIAWIPMGIGKDEAVDILLWAIGEDVAQLRFTHWPERIRENTGIVAGPYDSIFRVMRKVALEWRRKKPMIFHSRN